MRIGPKKKKLSPTITVQPFLAKCQCLLALQKNKK